MHWLRAPFAEESWRIFGHWRHNANMTCWNCGWSLRFTTVQGITMAIFYQHWAYTASFCYPVRSHSTIPLWTVMGDICVTLRWPFSWSPAALIEVLSWRQQHYPGGKPPSRGKKQSLQTIEDWLAQKSCHTCDGSNLNQIHQQCRGCTPKNNKRGIVTTHFTKKTSEWAPPTLELKHFASETPMGCHEGISTTQPLNRFRKYCKAQTSRRNNIQNQLLKEFAIGLIRKAGRSS